MNYPQSFSFTLTNSCNLRCKMCGQWSEEGYMQDQVNFQKNEMKLESWKKIVDDISAHGASGVLLRGGETFLYPDIMELLEYLASKNLHISIDTNGTLLKKYAADLVKLDKLHITISVDGPEAIHDQVRGVKGTFAKLKEGIEAINALDPEQKISRSINFTISPYSYKGLSLLPDIARSLDIRAITIVPYYWYSKKVGERYKAELQELGCSGYSWEGFHHEESGISPNEFLVEYRAFKESLGDVYLYPYMPIKSEEEYLEWFKNPDTQIGPKLCNNVERLIDIQPQGDVNFCVDLIDYVIGNVQEASIEDIWKSEKAEKFREMRRKDPLGVCYRCGAKYMSEIHE